MDLKSLNYYLVILYKPLVSGMGTNWWVLSHVVIHFNLYKASRVADIKKSL